MNRLRVHSLHASDGFGIYLIPAGIALLVMLNLVNFNLFSPLPLVGGFSLALPLYALILLGIAQTFKAGLNQFPLLIGYSIFILMYLIYGQTINVFSSNNTIEPLQIEIIKDAIFNLLTVILVYEWFVTAPERHLEKMFRMLILLLIFSNLFTIYQYAFQIEIIGPEFYEESRDYEFVSRAYGFYLNPNAAGFAALISMILAVSQLVSAFQNRMVSLILLVTAVIAGTLTFSKTFFICLAVSFIFTYVFFLRNRGEFTKATLRVGGLFLLLISGVLLYFLFNFESLKESLVEDQLDRILVFSSIFGGSQTEDLTTGRSTLAEYGMSLIYNNPLLGHGLGSFNDLKGLKITEGGVSQGVHNLFLMIWGETGLLFLLAFLFFLFSLFRNILQIKVHYAYYFSILFVLNYFINNFTNHNILTNYMISFILGIVLAFSVRYKNENVNQFGTTNLP